MKNNLTLSFDWYKTEIDDAIMLYSLTYAGYRCFGSGTVTSVAEAAEQAATPGCVLTPRDLNNGSALNASLSYDNQATIDISGLDATVNWARPSVRRLSGFNFTATILDDYETKTSPAPYDPADRLEGLARPVRPAHGHESRRV